MSGILQDLRHSLRILARNPGTTAVAVLSLALAIGPNSMLFGVVDRLFLRPATVEGISAIYFLNIKSAHQGVWESPGFAEFPAYQSATKDLADCVAESGHGGILTANGASSVVSVGAVSGNYFSVLGVHAAAGRTLVDSDQRFEGDPPVLLGYSLWQRHFAADPAIVGKTVSLSFRKFRVVGIAPLDFRPPMQHLIGPDAWVPLASEARRPGAPFAVEVTLRLHPGINAAQVAGTLTGVIAQSPDHRGSTATLQPVNDRGRVIVGTMVLALIGLVLLIACANIAGILLAQGEARRREFAMRLALGAGRYRLVRQLVSETLILSAVASALGLLLARWLISIIPALMPTLPLAFDLGLHIDGRLLAYTLLLSVVTTLAAGLVPALRFSRPDLIEALKGESTGMLSRSWFRAGLIVAQIAFAQFLLAGTGLLLRTYFQVERIRPGFDPDRPILFAILIPNNSSARPDFDQLTARLRSIPGVRRVSNVQNPPLSGSGNMPHPVTIPGGAAEPIGIQGNGAGPEYFTAMGTAILRGRDFTSADTNASAIVNEQMARRFFGDIDHAVGRFLTIDGRDRQIVGVIETGKYRSLTEEPAPYFATYASRSESLVIEAAPGQSLAAISVAFRQTISRTEPNLTIHSLTTLHQQMGMPLYFWRASSGLFGVSAILGIFLSAVGLFGVVSHSVRRRYHEIGVRVALGASPADIWRLVLHQAFTMVAIGAALGTAAAIAGARVLSSFLYKVSPADPVALIAALVAVAAVTLLALHYPARRATTVDPNTVLR